MGTTLLVQEETIRISRIATDPYDANAYVVVCPKTGDSVLVDAPAQADRLLTALENTQPQYILITHNHMDHFGALAELSARLRIPTAAHAADAERLPIKPQRLLADGDMISLGQTELQVIHTPGHTPGGLCFLVGKHLLSGDTVFPDGPGRTPSPAAFEQIIESITTRVFSLSDDTRIYPGHGEFTTVAAEKKNFAVFASKTHAPNLFGEVIWLST